MFAPATQSWNALQQHESAASDLEEIITGLSKKQKMISPKFFYDLARSRLFDRVCELRGDCPTRTEVGVLQANIDEMAELIGPQASLIEFGSGSSLKTRILLEHMDQPAVYVPVDISRSHLLESAAGLSDDFPHLEILPVVADFTQTFPLPNPKVMPVRNLVYFPGCKK